MIVEKIFRPTYNVEAANETRVIKIGRKKTKVANDLEGCSYVPLGDDRKSLYVAKKAKCGVG